MVPAWLLYGSVLALVAFNVALSVYWLRRLRDGAPEAAPGRAAGGAERRADDGTVECPSCGAVNDADYRYCRECVTELPGQLPSVNGQAGPRGRLG